MESQDSDRPRSKGRDRDKDRGRGRRSAVPKAEVRQPETPALIEEATTIIEARTDSVNTEQQPKADNRKPQHGARNAVRQQSPANDDQRERRQRHHRDHDDGPTPVGFGDDIPAFMLIVAGAKG
jgi:hypothetical protein